MRVKKRSLSCRLQLAAKASAPVEEDERMQSGQGETDDGFDSQRRHERIVLVILAAVQFITIVDFMIVMPLGPQLMRTLEIEPAEFGLIVSSYTFAAGVAGILASSVVDRFARRTTFMVLYAGFLLGTLLCAVANGYAMLLAARVATGAFGGLVGGMAMTIIGDVFPERRRGLATSSLMIGFALASAFGLPLGLMLGTRYDWHVPFFVLVAAGLPVLFLVPFALPPLRDHIGKAQAHPLRAVLETFSHANHLNAFALIIVLMIGNFTVFPYVPDYLVHNVGMAENQLPWLYLVGGGLTLVAAPLVGWLADRFGKLRMYLLIAPLSAVMMLTVTQLPPVSVVVAVLVFGLLMVVNVGRMIPATALVTGSVEPSRRGGFLSVNASLQHVASGVGACLGGMIVVKTADGRIEHFHVVGWIAAVATLVSLWLVCRIRPFAGHEVSAEAISLPAAAEAAVDAGEPLVNAGEEAPEL